MSPMPIREAVRRLDAAGLVENIPHRGARVTELSITDLAEVYEVRLAVEVLAIRRAAERFTDADAEHARRCLQELESCRRHHGGHHRGPRGVPLRVLRGRRVGLAAAAHPAGVGDQRALRAGGRRSVGSRSAPASTGRSWTRATPTTPTGPRWRSTTTWPRPPTTSPRPWATGRCTRV